MNLLDWDETASGWLIAEHIDGGHYIIRRGIGGEGWLLTHGPEVVASNSKLASVEEAKKVAELHHLRTHRQRRWKVYMEENDPPE